MVDDEAELRAELARAARDFVTLLRQGLVATTAGAVDQLVDKAFGSSERLQDAVELLGKDEGEARALLTRAVRYAEDPPGPEEPRRRERPDASRFGRPTSEDQPGG